MLTVSFVNILLLKYVLTVRFAYILVVAYTAFSATLSYFGSFVHIYHKNKPCNSFGSYYFALLI